MTNLLKVACVQLNTADKLQANIEAIRTHVQNAATQGAQLIALPENALLMESPSVARTLYTEAEHPGILAVSAMAKQHSLWLLLGSVAVKTDNSGKTVNRSILFNHEGIIAARYDKIHLFDVTLPNGETYAESARVLHGAEATLIKTPFAALGLTICYDVRFPHLYRALAQGGATILAIPAAFTATTGQGHWHVLLRARAIENGCFVLAPAQCGTHPGNRKTFGHSLIIDPWGTILADGGTEAGIIIADLDMRAVTHTRATLPSLHHSRDFTLKTC